MQGICHLSRRWHQQFCHSPSFGPHKHCFDGSIAAIRVPARYYRSGSRTGKSSSQKSVKQNKDQEQRVTSSVTPDVTKKEFYEAFAPSVQFARKENDEVKQWEQIGDDASTRRRVAPDNSLRQRAESVWSSIWQTEKELEELDEEDDDDASDLYGPNSELIQSLPAEHRAEFLKILEDNGFGTTRNEEEDVLDLREIEQVDQTEKNDLIRGGLRVDLQVPQSHHMAVKRFNKAILDWQSRSDDVEKNMNMWKWYLRCQQRVPGFASYLSPRIWGALWASQVGLGARPQHIALLGSDMIKANARLSPEKELAFLRALIGCNDLEPAMQRWEALRETFTMDALREKHKAKDAEELLTAFYGLGSEMQAAIKGPRAAQAYAMEGIEEGASPTVLVQAIIGWAKSKSPHAASRAFALYLHMRSRLGSSMTPQLYEQISDALMGERRSELALAVFKDLISSIQGSATLTLDNYERALGTISMNGTPAEVEQAINQVSLSMLLALPRANENKFFFASWMKKLIGQGQLESAAMVLELMFERRIKPDAMHMHGLIGAWLRSGNAEQREKAADLARQMIHVRLERVKRRKQRPTEPDDPVPIVLAGGVPNDRPLPAATQETFLLLFNYLADRRERNELDQMYRLMTGLANLKPNAMIMNKFLAIELESRSLQRFWYKFEDMSRSCAANLETYMLIWQALNINVTTGAKLGGQWSSPRQVFAKIMDWSQRLPNNKLAMARQEFNDNSYSTIMRTLIANNDWAGLVSAMQGLYQTFQATPDDMSLQLVMNLAARELPRAKTLMQETKRIRRRGENYRQDMTFLRTITSMVGELEQNRRALMLFEGVATNEDLQDPQSTISRKLRLDVMTEFVVVVLKRLEKDNSNIHKTLTDVSKIMHVDISHLDIDGMLS